jgi:hypothetical protein
MDFALNLEALVREVEDHVASAGWDQPVRLFALVPTVSLLETNPQVAAELGISADLPLTSVEQEISDSLELDELLATIAWPTDVVGALVALERIVLPPSAQSDLPDENENELVQAAADHPDRRDVRIISAVLRTGENLNALRHRTHDSADAVAVSPDLVTRLNEALAATFAE